MAQAMKDHLLEQVMAFWRAHTIDPARGYHTCLNREGRLMENEKNIWMQARQVWMFSKIYSDVDHDPAWLRLARHGRDYLVRSKAYEGQGRWNYLLDPEDGRVRVGTVSLYTDAFALMALSAYAEASGEGQDETTIMDTFHALNLNVRDPAFKDVFPQEYRPDIAIHGLHMISLYAAAQAAGVVPGEKTESLIHYCMDQMLGTMLDEEANCLLEVKHRNGRRVEDAQGRMVNPGHNFEGLWFITQQADRLGRKADGNRAAQLTLDMWRRARDPAGGVFYMLDVEGAQVGQCDWNQKRALQWDEKVWWTHAEALVALLYAAIRLRSQEGFEAFQRLFNYCLEHFWDKEYGEWYSVLHRDGTPRLTQKGGMQKAAFHVPRSLYVCYHLLKEWSR